MVMKHKKLKKEAVTISVIKQSSPIAVVKEEYQDMDKFSVLSIQAENSIHLQNVKLFNVNIQNVKLFNVNVHNVSLLNVNA